MIRTMTWIWFCRNLTLWPGQMSAILIYLIKEKYWKTIMVLICKRGLLIYVWTERKSFDLRKEKLHFSLLTVLFCIFVCLHKFIGRLSHQVGNCHPPTQRKVALHTISFLVFCWSRVESLPLVWETGTSPAFIKSVIEFLSLLV